GGAQRFARADRRSNPAQSDEGSERRRAPAGRGARGRALDSRRDSAATPLDRRSARRRARGRDGSAGPPCRPDGAAGVAGRAAVARSQSAARRRRSAGAEPMSRALLVVFLSVAAASSATATGPRRAGADPARAAALPTALDRTDPVICDLIGDQLGNFWIGGNAGGLGRFSDAPAGLQGAKDSLAGRITDPRALQLLIATLGSNNACVRRVAAKLLGRSAVSARSEERRVGKEGTA